MATLAAGGWFARSAVPPATLWLARGAISLEVDSAARQPGPALKTLTASQLQGDGLYAFTAINAPLGLTGTHSPRLVQTARWLTVSNWISAVGEPGYRAWTHKTNFRMCRTVAGKCASSPRAGSGSEP